MSLAEVKHGGKREITFIKVVAIITEAVMDGECSSSWRRVLLSFCLHLHVTRMKWNKTELWQRHPPAELPQPRAKFAGVQIRHAPSLWRRHPMALTVYAVSCSRQFFTLAATWMTFTTISYQIGFGSWNGSIHDSWNRMTIWWTR